MVIERIDLDLSLKFPSRTVRAKQGDRETRFIEATLFYGNEVYNVPENAKVIISYLKPDGKEASNEVPDEKVNGNKVTFSLSEQMLTTAGTAICDLKIIDSDNVGIISTCSFKVLITPQAVPDGTVKSKDEYNTLINALIRTEQGEQERYNAEQQRLVSEENRGLAENERRQNELARQDNEDERVSAEEVRIANEELRLNYYYVTQEEYDTLSQEDKDNPKFVYEIIDDEGEYPQLLQGLIDNLEQSKQNYDTAVKDNTHVEIVEARGGEENLKARLDKMGKIHTSVFTAISTTSTILHNLSYDIVHDDLLVLYQGVMLEEGVNYNHLSSTAIRLLDWSVSSGERMYFRLYKNVR